jgi:hypothetical protein
MEVADKADKIERTAALSSMIAKGGLRDGAVFGSEMHGNHTLRMTLFAEVGEIPPHTIGRS